ncbi:hypothetical protein GCM10010191_48230 [Actinomadura vinacea]|uniref:Methyltransferase FkbM domain-containing protein n=1 Tax=Actinomadura vinacea TaxID=115336 RepID=A0ABN3JGM6_9ACTN
MGDVSLVSLDDEFRFYTPTDPAGDYLELKWIFREVFEEDMYRAMFAEVPPDGVVLDVGANVGLFTLLLKRERPNAVVHAFEPAPDCVEALRRNVDLQGLSDVTVHPVGIGAEGRSSVPFTYYPRASGNSTRYPEQKKNYGHGLLKESSTIEVEVQTLSAVLARCPELARIDLLKIDVEGAEEDVLLGLAEADWKKVNALVIEVEDLDGRLGRIESLLAAQGFSTTREYVPMVPKEHRLFIVRATRPPA